MGDVASEAHHYQFPVLIFHKEDKTTDIRNIHYETVGVPSLTVTQAYSKIPVYYEDVEKPISIEIPEVGQACTQYYHGKCFNALIKMILRCEEENVRRLLEAHRDRDRETLLDIRCACNKSHFSDSIVTASNCFGFTALMFAVKTVGCHNSVSTPQYTVKAEIGRRICKVLLQYGADPNTCSSTGTAVLDCAATFADKPLMEILVAAGAYVSRTLERLGMQTGRPGWVSKKQKKAHEAFTVEPIRNLLHEDILMCSPDPILTCFYSCIVLINIERFRADFADVIKKMRKELHKIPFDYINLCKDGWEARSLLMQEVLTSEYRKMSLLDYSVMCNQKTFCSHKFIQHISQGVWYGDSYTSTWSSLLKRLFVALIINLVFPVLYFNAYIRRLEPPPFGWEHYFLKQAKTPAVGFIVDLMNHLILVGLLIAACNKTNNDEDYYDVFLWLALLSRLVIEYDFLRVQGWRMYAANIINVINVVVGSSLFMSLVTTLSYTYTTDTDAKAVLILVTSHIHSVSAMALMIRLLEMFDITKTLGPLTEAIKRMLKDVANFIVLMALTIFSFSIPMWTVAYQSARVLKQFKNGSGTPTDNFASYSHTVGYLAWSLFGLGDGFGGSVDNDSYSSAVLNTLYFLYLVAAVLLLMNLLIAILNNTYAGVVERADIEYKFSRIKRVIKYKGVQPFLFPFILYIYPFYKMSRFSQKYRKMKDSNVRRNICNSLIREEVAKENVKQSVYLHQRLKARYLKMRQQL